MPHAIIFSTFFIRLEILLFFFSSLMVDKPKQNVFSKRHFGLAWNWFLCSQIGAKLQWKKQLKYSGLILTSLAGKVRYTHSAWLVLTFSFIHKPGSHTFSLVLTLSSWHSCQHGTLYVSLVLTLSICYSLQPGNHSVKLVLTSVWHSRE
jgi:hypothetical protein